MSTDYPLISVYIPTKNRLSFLKKAIESVKAQDYNNWELIIVNDASEDGTKDFLDSLSDSKIRVIHHTESKGACISRNEAIFSASGDFITGLDDDDYFSTERLSYFLKEWKNDSDNVALCTDNIAVINGIPQNRKIGNYKYIKQRDLLYFNHLNNQIFTKTEYLKSIGGFEPSLQIWQDYECWYRLLSIGRAKKLPVPTYFFDISDRHDRISNKNKKKALNSVNVFINKNNLTKSQSQLLRIPLLYYGNEKLSMKFLLEMLYYSKGNKNYFKFFEKEVLAPLILKFKLFFS